LTDGSHSGRRCTIQVNLFNSTPDNFGLTDH
jgi:hypothetical protein